MQTVRYALNGSDGGQDSCQTERGGRPSHLCR